MDARAVPTCLASGIQRLYGRLLPGFRSVFRSRILRVSILSKADTRKRGANHPHPARRIRFKTAPSHDMRETQNSSKMPQTKAFCAV